MTALTVDELIVSLSRANAASKVFLQTLANDRAGSMIGRHRDRPAASASSASGFASAAAVCPPDHSSSIEDHQT